MQVKYEHSENSAPMYHVYLSDDRKHPEDELHIWSADISFVNEMFYEQYNTRFNYNYLKQKFNEAMIDCVRKQLEIR